MKIKSPYVVMFLSLIFTFMAQISSFGQNRDVTINNEVIVYFKSGIQDNKNTIEINSQSVKQILDKFNISKENIFKAFPDFDKKSALSFNEFGSAVTLPDLSKIYLLRVKQGVSRKELVNDLLKNDNVLYAEINSMPIPLGTPNDELFSEQWSLKNTGQNGGTIDADIDADEAWDIYTGNSNNIIALFDGGINKNRTDLSGKVIGDDGTGWYGHGTATAAVAGAKTNNNGIGMAGVDWNVKLMAKRIDYQGAQTICNKIISASDNNNVKVMNHSWMLDPGEFNITVRLGFAYSYKMNKVSIAAAGNSGLNEKFYPAAYSLGVMAISNTDSIDHLNIKSTWGEQIAVSAPGSSILTINNDGTYGPWSGTSFSAPIVSGIASLLKGYKSTLYNDDIEMIIKLSSEDKDPIPGWDNKFGWGRVNAKKALDMVKNNIITYYTSTGSSYYSESPYTYFNFLGADGLTDRMYWGWRYEIRKTVTFPHSINPKVWGRGIGSNCWQKDEQNEYGQNYHFGMPFCEVVPGTVTNTSAVIRSYIYQLSDNSIAGPYSWYPITDKNQAVFAYTVLSEPSKIVNIQQNIEIIYPGQTGYVTCNTNADQIMTFEWKSINKPDYIHIFNLTNKSVMVDNDYRGSNEKVEFIPTFKLRCIISSMWGLDSLEYAVSYSTSGGGCPFLFVNTDNGYVMDNNLLHRSEFEGNAGKDIKDVYKLNANPISDKNKLKFQIKELNRDHSYFDRIKLYSVDHPAGSEIGVTENNDLVVYLPTGVVSSSNALLNDKNVTDLIQYNLKSPGVEGVSNDRLFMNFNSKSFDFKNILKSLNAEGAADSVAVIMNTEGVVIDPIDPPKEIAGTIEGNESAENTFQRGFARREKQSVVIVPLSRLTSLDSLNIDWRRDYDLQYAAITPILYGGYEKKELNLVAADHSVYGNIKQLLKSLDKDYAELDTNGFITLTFNTGGNVKAGWVRDYVIETDGYYLRPGVGENIDMVGKSLQKELISGTALPTKYELNANYPNPFNPSTTIEYAVPQKGLVTIKVYDVLGREVATLVNDNHAQGRYKVTWNAAGLSSGIYIYRLTAKDYKSVRKMLLIK